MQKHLPETTSHEIAVSSQPVSIMRRQLLLGAASSALLAACGGGNQGDLTEASSGQADVMLPTGTVNLATPSAWKSLSYVESQSPNDKVLIPNVSFSPLGSVFIAICKIQAADLQDNSARIPIVQSADGTQIGCGLDVTGAAMAVPRAIRMRWRNSAGGPVAASYTISKGLGAPFGERNTGDRWIAVVARITGENEMPVTEQFITNQFKQPANSIFMYWSPLPDPDTFSSGALQPGYGNVGNGSDGPLSIDGSLDHGVKPADLGSLKMEIKSVAHSSGTRNVVMRVARVIKIDARTFVTPSNGASISVPLTFDQIEQVIAGYTPTSLGLGGNDKDIWIDMGGPQALINRIGSRDFNASISGNPTFRNDGPMLYDAI